MGSSLSEKLANVDARSRGGRPCLLDLLLDDLVDRDPDGYKDLIAALQDRGRFSTPAIASALQAEGHEITESTIYRYRRLSMWERRS